MANYMTAASQMVKKQATAPAAAPVADPNALIQEAFVQSRKNLQGQKTQALDEMKANVNRQQAMTGMSGGTASKVQSKAQRELETGFAGKEAELAASEAGAKAQEAQTARQLNQQQQQFAEQMKFSWAEMDENKKTNLLNAMMALSKVDVKEFDWSRFANQYDALTKGYAMKPWYQWPSS